MSACTGRCAELSVEVERLRANREKLEEVAAIVQRYRVMPPWSPSIDAAALLHEIQAVLRRAP